MVPASSPFRTLDDMIRALRDRPESLSWGGGSAGGSDQILAGLVAERSRCIPGPHQLRGVLRWRRIALRRFWAARSRSASTGWPSSSRRFRPEPCARWRSRARIACRASTCQPCASKASTSSSRTGDRSLARPESALPERQRLESLIAAMVATPEWRAALERYRWLDRLPRRRCLRALRRWRGDQGADDAPAARDGTGRGGALASVGRVPGLRAGRARALCRGGSRRRTHDETSAGIASCLARRCPLAPSGGLDWRS